jgi:hypothetical protein
VVKVEIIYSLIIMFFWDIGDEYIKMYLPFVSSSAWTANGHRKPTFFSHHIGLVRQVGKSAGFG